MRIDGVVSEYVKIQKNIHGPLIARIKILANLDIAEKRIPQDGHFRVALGDGQQVNIRVSVLPTVFGEKAVLRIMAATSHLDLQIILEWMSTVITCSDRFWIIRMESFILQDRLEVEIYDTLYDIRLPVRQTSEHFYY